MFELSRDTDMTTHFDPAIHSLDAILSGIPGHVPLVCRECDVAELPAEQADRGVSDTFRDAWEDTGTITVNMAKARVIHMDRIRRVRDQGLVNLDV